MTRELEAVILKAIKAIREMGEDEYISIEKDENGEYQVYTKKECEL